MPSDHQSLFAENYLWSEYGAELDTFRGSQEEHALLERLRFWSERELQNETTAQNAFVDRFFKQLWGYTLSGEQAAADGYTCYPQFAVGRAGAGGGTGQADLALGIFGLELFTIPQVLCEFKDIRSGLDSPQRRKDNTRSPVEQCRDYLREAVASLSGSEPVQLHWGIVTDMNEFRLYRRISMPTQYQRFVISARTGDPITPLLEDSREASFQRLIFSRLFHVDNLIATAGDPPLIRDLKKQFVTEREIEQVFYREYRTYRERLIEVLRQNNPRFPGTRGRLVRIAQTILDRCIFVLFCEDMGRSLSFPPSILRDYLISFSTSEFYEAGGGEIWTTLRRLFAVMNAGGQFRNHNINRFNGGLFAQDLEIDALDIPNEVFCVLNQGASNENIRAYPRTLLYFSATYNFGNYHDGRAITLYTLGRIFEQSITELEALEAEAEGRVSLTKATKRKRAGVYYTPEWVVGQIVEETIGARLADLRRETNWDEGLAFSPAELEHQSRRVRTQIEAIDRYTITLDTFTVVDPACGSGAFLIYSLEYLLRERRRVAAERARLSLHAQLFDQEEQIREILARNIYGVDINPASVEISRLALWLHTARADRPLCDLNHNIRDGNSLISPTDLYHWDAQLALLPDEEKERINAFDWDTAFPEITARGGFDCVLGNPPYVKLQNFRKVIPRVAEFLRTAIAPTGGPLYRSTQAGNYDIFLPFIEHGIGLLNDQGRMGFIAPSLWLLNEYGAALRRFIHEGRYLDRWVDFKSHRVFEEATTYTALQFFTKAPNASVRFTWAIDGAIATSWNETAWQIPYEQLPNDDTWVLMPEPERSLVRRLSAQCARLDSVADIIVGLQTSADNIYHLKKVGPGRYESYAVKDFPVEIEIEDSIMRPLMSGKQTRRYVEPESEMFILFPYERRGDDYRLIDAENLQTIYPLAWRYLTVNEAALRAREGNQFDDSQWYRFGRNQSIDKQDRPKILVARLLINLGCALDIDGTVCLDNVDVGGVIPREQGNGFFLTAILNSPVANFVWRLISKPFQSDYRSANKQFIAPLPIPIASEQDTRWIAARAADLQMRITEVAHMGMQIRRRLDICEVTKFEEDRIVATLGSLESWKRQAPAGFGAKERTQWAKIARKKKLDSELTELARKLSLPGTINVQRRDGELIVCRGDSVILDKVFVSDKEGEFIRAQWQLSIWALGDAPTAAELINALRSIRTTENAELRSQVIDRVRECEARRAVIAASENAMNERIFQIYQITPEEHHIIIRARG